MFASDVDSILNNKDKLLTQIYFDLQRYFEDKYGRDTVVFMEIGTFFEVYEVNNDEEQVGKAKEIAELLNIQLTKKNKNIIELLFYGVINYLNELINPMDRPFNNSIYF